MVGPMTARSGPGGAKSELHGFFSDGRLRRRAEVEPTMPAFLSLILHPLGALRAGLSHGIVRDKPTQSDHRDTPPEQDRIRGVHRPHTRRYQG